MEQLLTGHYKNLSSAEWLESADYFIKGARTTILRAKTGIFGRDYRLQFAEEKIALAEKCLAYSQLQRKRNRRFLL
jgi:hypothetical protein